MNAAGSAVLGNIKATGRISINATAGDIRGGTFDTDGALSLVASGSIGTDKAPLQVKASEITELRAGQEVDLELLGSGGRIGTLNAVAADISSAGAVTVGSGDNWTLDRLSVNTPGSFTSTGTVKVTGQVRIDNAKTVDLGATGAVDLGSVVVGNVGQLDLRDSNALSVSGTVKGTARVTASGALGLGSLSAASLVTKAASISGEAPVTVTGATTLRASGPVSLTGANNFGNTVSLDVSGAVTLRDVNGLTLDGSSGGLSATTDAGDLTIGGLNVNGSAILRSANDITDTGILLATGALTLSAGGDNGIVLDNGHALSGSVTIERAKKATVKTTGGLTMSGQVTGTADFTAGGTLALSNFTSGDRVDLSGTAVSLGTVAAGANLSVVANGGGIAGNSGAVRVAGQTSLAAANGTVALNHVENDFAGDVTVNAGSADLRDANTLAVGGTVTGTLTLQSGGAATLLALSGGGLNFTGTSIAQRAGTTVSLSGASAISARGGDVALDAAGNDFGSLSLTDTANAKVRDANELVLGTSALTGSLQVNAASGLKQTGALRVDGDTVLNGDLAAGASASDIDFSQTGNRFGGAVSIGLARNVSLGSTAALHLVSANVQGGLDIVSAGRIYNADSWTVTGDVTIDATGQSVELTAAHDFQGTVNVDAAALIINDINDLKFGTLDLSGGLTVTAGGSVIGTGRAAVGGAVTLTAGAASSVTFDQAANDFGGVVTITRAGTVTLSDTNALALGNLDLDGGLSVVAGGNVTTGVLTIVGDVTVSGETISLNAEGNVLAGTFHHARSASTQR